ncbi:MAG: ABC transporter ATP-binding protein [Alphaproteobacteria bacterium]|nr:ABC transporter ATP-binding protein [Alphaproteobacteria bacterium]
MSNPVLQLSAICRTFIQAENKLDVLKGCELTVHAREKVALIGPSGAGKSTLLHIAGLLEKPDSGEIQIAGQPASDLNDTGRTALRLSSIGFVYQFHHLLPEFSARENIILPQMIAGVTKEKAGQRADELLDLINLLPRASHRPSQLSGGEQQRIAIARALANRPALLIADEPTGNLDPHTAGHVFEVLHHVANNQELGLLMATHNHDLAQRMDRICELKEGVLIEV